MKKILFIALALFAANYAAAASEQAAVEAQVKALSEAMVSADAKALKALTENELSYGHSGGEIQNQAQFIEKITSGKSDFVAIDLEDQTVSIVDDIAIVRHMLSADTNDRGKPGHVEIGIMLIWKKDHGEWKLLARQAYKPH